MLTYPAFVGGKTDVGISSIGTLKEFSDRITTIKQLSDDESARNRREILVYGQAPNAANFNSLIVDGNWKVSFFAKNLKKFLRHGGEGFALIEDNKRLNSHLLQFWNIE